MRRTSRAVLAVALGGKYANKKRVWHPRVRSEERTKIRQKHAAGCGALHAQIPVRARGRDMASAAGGPRAAELGCYLRGRDRTAKPSRRRLSLAHPKAKGAPGGGHSASAIAERHLRKFPFGCLVGVLRAAWRPSARVRRACACASNSRVPCQGACALAWSLLITP